MPEKPVLVSIVIPMYNAEKTIKLCLDAVFKQDYPEFEVIVVDDCSKDNSLEIVQNYNARYIRMPENRGPAEARQEGARNANGEIIAFTDSDCVPHPDWLSFLVSKLSRDYGGVGGIYEPYDMKNCINRFAIGDQFYLWFKNQIRDASVLATGNCIYWKDVLLDRKAPESIIMQGIASGDDTLMSLEITRKHRIKVFKESRMPHIDRTNFRDLMIQKARRGTSRAIISLLFPRDKVMKTKDINMPEVALNLLMTMLLVPSFILLIVFFPKLAFIPFLAYLILNINYFIFWIKREKGIIFPLFAMLMQIARNFAFIYGGIRGVFHAFTRRKRMLEGREFLK